jgi:hypothetical protein
MVVSPRDSTPLDMEELSQRRMQGSGSAAGAIGETVSDVSVAIHRQSWWDGLLVLRGLAVYRLWRCGSCACAPMQGLFEICQLYHCIPREDAQSIEIKTRALFTSRGCVITNYWQ